MPKCPCRDCDERTPDCHAVCGLYAAYEAAKLREYDARLRERKGAGDIQEMIKRRKRLAGK